MARTIVVAIGKGGTAKTKTATELSAALFSKGAKVLLVDLDSQADATKSLGYSPTTLPYTINDLFLRRDLEPYQVVIHTPLGIDLLPSHKDLWSTEAGLKQTQVGMLRSILSPLEDQYNVVVIDTPHSGPWLPVMALSVANDVVIPMQTLYEAYEKLPEILTQVAQVKMGLNPEIRIDGVLPVMVHPRHSIDKAILELVEKDYPNLLYPMKVDYSTKISQSTPKAQPIVLADPSHPGAQAYIKLAERFI
jgi:chromosome partitioning protein